MGKEALTIDANTFQFFTRNPRGGKAKQLDQNDINKFLNLAKENNFVQLLAHAPYTLNACAADESKREFAVNTFIDDLKRLELTPNNLYNFHPGSHVKQGADVGIKYITDMLNQALTKEQTTTVLLETMSGKGTEVGRNFEELKAIIDGVEKLEGAKLIATDLIAGAAMVIAGLIANGETEIVDIEHIDRGYPHIEEKFRSLGADIRRVVR